MNMEMITIPPGCRVTYLADESYFPHVVGRTVLPVTTLPSTASRSRRETHRPLPRAVHAAKNKETIEMSRTKNTDPYKSKLSSFRFSDLLRAMIDEAGFSDTRLGPGLSGALRLWFLKVMFEVVEEGLGQADADARSFLRFDDVMDGMAKVNFQAVAEKVKKEWFRK